jgi:peptidoglycan hydrolase-like protein with peptidoglycan-binding domain
MGTFLSTKIMKITKIISAVSLVTLGLTSTTFASIDKNLKYGQRDKEVTELQEFLIDKGLLKTTPSNFFGLLTLRAVRSYQASVGVSSTGYVGVLTRQKINDELAVELASSTQAEIQETGTTTKITYNTTPATTTIVAIDFCKNIEGLQTVVPSGMFLDSKGNCFTPSVSVSQPVVTQTQSSGGQSGTQQTQTPAVTQPASTILTPTLTSSPASQLVVGGSSFAIAMVNFKSINGSASISELHFTSNNASAIESITVGGKTGLMKDGSATVSSPNITITEAGIDAPVVVTFSGSINSNPVSITLDNVKDSTGKMTSASVTSNSMYVVGSVPTLSANTSPKDVALGAENKLGEFTIVADANGQVDVESLSFSSMVLGVQSPQITSLRVTDNDSFTAISGSSVTGTPNLQVSFSPKYQIPAGVARTISFFGNVLGQSNGQGNPSIVIAPNTSTLTWTDHTSGTTQIGAKGSGNTFIAK